MFILCLEGCHGCGKTALFDQLQSAGLPCFDEGFMNQPENLLHPQSLTMETHWMSQWFRRVLDEETRRRKLGEDTSNCVLVADRSPFSAVFYAKSGNQLLEGLIREHIKEVQQAGIYIFCVHIRVDEEVLWRRILARLKAEPEREKYNEHKREWMEETLRFYNGMKWDVEVDNSQDSVAQLVANLFQNPVVSRICMETDLVQNPMIAQICAQSDVTYGMGSRRIGMSAPYLVDPMNLTA
mmetsp:Transcript_24367/g.57640  ORF Transcript_24367/g.57640 Transcript_24367/m.57640 type:complete len:239 (-) Transcript_24367:48-764(-)